MTPFNKILHAINVHINTLSPLLDTIVVKWDQNKLECAAQSTADYQPPVNILGKYERERERERKKSMHLFVPGQGGREMCRQMLESPLSSLNKQPNWADLLIIYRIESRGATAFVGDTQPICVRQEGFVFHHRLSL